MRLRVRHTDLFITECATRLPFRFGSVTLDRAPLCLGRMRVETEDGRTLEGFASDLLVPKWFEKDPAKTPREDSEDLLRSAQAAARAFVAGGDAPRTVFDAWLRVHEERVGGQPLDAPDLLVRGFGVALFERALMDAACRAAGLTFAAALRGDLFAFRPDALFPELAGWSPASSLPRHPGESVLVRHTVGMADPLRTSEIPPEARVDDGLPQALDEDIRLHGVRRFKVKIGAGEEADAQRLLDLAGLLDELDLGDCRWTADGNEQFADLAQLLQLLRTVAHQDPGRRLLARLDFIEQPLPRDRTFDAAACAAMDAVREFAPVIIDEADATPDAFRRAARLGYAGVSVKNCKGVFRALLNRGLCDRSDGAWFQTAEDLTNLGGVALQQNLATIAAFGFADAELNGHHYFRGLQHLPREEAEAAAGAHPDLYAATAWGPALKIAGGRLALGSVQCPGFGYAFPVATPGRQPAERWLAGAAS